MTKEEISRAIEDCEARIEECEVKLKRLREDLNKPEYDSKRWKPKKDEKIFFISACGDIFDARWDGSDVEKLLYELGNVFFSEEAAQFEIERRKVIAELSDFAESDDAVWDGNQVHYPLYYDYISNCVGSDFDQCFKRGCLYFPSREAARAAVEAVGEERVKKYYFGVKED